MQADSGGSLQMHFARSSKNPIPAAEEEQWNKRTTRFVVLVFALNIISAGLFIAPVHRPVYDVPFNVFDVHNYATRGLSMETLLSHRNPPGPTGFLWMAAGVRLLGGNELTDARIAVLVAWLLLAGGVLVGSRRTRFPQLWYGAFLATLVFPHAVEASATLLTEGPSLLFAVLGALAWTEFASEPNASPRAVLLGMLGGLSMGLAVTCRQYYLALLAAAALLALGDWQRPAFREKSRWAVSAICSLVLPVLLMVLVWKGISSPGMATGTSYGHMWKAAVGLNLFRPIVVTFYGAVYLLPLTFPAMFRMEGPRRRIAILFAVLGGAVVTIFSSLVLQPGPLNSLVQFASRLPYGGTAPFAVISIVALYNAACVSILLWEQRQAISSCAPAVFALLVIVFFVAEQFGVAAIFPFTIATSCSWHPFWD